MELIRAKKAHLHLDLAPLIDVIFQLLIFFMLTSAFANPAIKLDLPKAVSDDKVEQANIVVSIDSEGGIFLDDQKTTMATFKDDLREILLDHDEKAIHIRGDQQMPYRFFVEVMDLARQVNVEQINIIHQTKEQQ